MHLGRGVDARERWQILQTRLASARALADAGDRGGALREIDEALGIDPEFLAAHSLKQRLAAIADTPLPASAPAQALNAFETRARARRAERRLSAATGAIESRDFARAAEAIDEARELGADTDGVLRVERALVEAQLERPAGRTVVGRFLAAAATVTIGVLGAATYIGERGADITLAPAAVTASASQSPDVSGDAFTIVQPQTEIVRLPPRTPPEPPRVLEAPVKQAIPPPVLSASLDRTSVSDPPQPAVAPAPAVSQPAVVLPPVPVPVASNALAPISQPEPPPARVDPAPVSAMKVDSTVARNDSSVMPAIQPAELVVPRRTNEDDSGVRQVLQRYRAAYDQLNARSARAVWPAVNERALAQAFEGLSSQQLNFDACDVQLHGDAATATCRGTAKYVTRVGSNEPQVEPRTWKFVLRKAGTGWAIDTARTERRSIARTDATTVSEKR